MKRGIIFASSLLVMLYLNSCKKSTEFNNSTMATTSNSKGNARDINEQLSIASKEDSTILDDEKKYKRMVVVYDESKQYWIKASISTDNEETFNHVVADIENFLTIDISFQGFTSLPDNAGDPYSNQGDVLDVSAKHNITCIVVSTHLPKNALGFVLNHKPHFFQAISYGAPEIADESIGGAEGYFYGWEYATLSNGLVTFNRDVSPINQKMKVIREYKKRWYNTSWSSWGYAEVWKGANDNYCIKDKNRIRVRVYYNPGTFQSCGTYGSSSC